MITVLLSQIILMFAMMFTGTLMYKTGKMTSEGARCLGNILISVILPFVVIKSFMTECTAQRLSGLFITFAAALLALILSMLLSRLIFNSSPMSHFSAAFSNAGFIGIPLVSAMFGDEAVFYVSSFVALLNIFQWTYGVFVITHDKRTIAVKKVLTNPVLIGLIIGLIFFFIPLETPEIVYSFVSAIAAMNAPVAMFNLGAYLAQTKFRQIFTDKHAYLVSLVRLIVIPLCTIALLSLIPFQNNTIKIALLIVAAAPVGSNAAIFAQIHNKDYQHAVRCVCLSTLLSLPVLPLLTALAGALWHVAI